MPEGIAPALVGAIATIITVVPTLLITVTAVRISDGQRQLEEKKAERELFEKFNKRFNKMNEDLNAIREGLYPESASRKAKNIAQDYLNLCSEEYLCYKRGLIKVDIWKVWLSGIEYYLCKEDACITKVFAEEMINAPESYYGLFECEKITRKLAVAQKRKTEND